MMLSSLSVTITNCVYDKNFYHAWLLTALHCLLNWFGTKCDSMLRKYYVTIFKYTKICMYQVQFTSERFTSSGNILDIHIQYTALYIKSTLL